VLEMIVQAAQHDGPGAAAHLAAWANQRYDMGWTPEAVSQIQTRDLHDQLTAASEQWWDGGKLEALVDQAISDHADPAALATWVGERFGKAVTEDELAGLEAEALRKRLLDAGRAMLRGELTQLERFVLLQILDTSWKDHLYAMDQIKDSVGLRGYAERDPRIEYKREGSSQFTQMRRTVRDRVTDLIFRAKLTANAEPSNVYHDSHARQADPASGGSPAAAAAEQGTAQQRADLDAAQQAGSDRSAHLSRRQRRAAEKPTAAAASSKPTQPLKGKKRKRKSR
jgi:preprotein translocase subunit SecA